TLGDKVLSRRRLRYRCVQYSALDFTANTALHFAELRELDISVKHFDVLLCCIALSSVAFAMEFRETNRTAFFNFPKEILIGIIEVFQRLLQSNAVNLFEPRMVIGFL